MFFNTLSIKNVAISLVLVSYLTFQSFAHGSSLQNDGEHIFSSTENMYITVLNEEELTNNYKIDDAGMILMPLIGKVHVSGLSASKIEASISTLLQDGYILNPVISVSTAKVNSFYILGEVKNPGRYDLPNEQLNILKAVAIAGGFTYRANKNVFEIMRHDSDRDEKKIHNNNAVTKLLSGDIIIVKERFF